jgi:Thymidylate synthase complementing protein
MRLVRKPKVYLIDKQMLDDEAVGTLHSDSGARNWVTNTRVSAEALVETAGLTCHRSFGSLRPGRNKAYTYHVLQMGHGSVLEHGMFAYIETVVSRILTRELVRHRSGWAHSQSNQRYVNESDVAVLVAHQMEAYMAWGDRRWTDSPKGGAAIGQDRTGDMKNDLAAYSHPMRLPLREVLRHPGLAGPPKVGSRGTSHHASRRHGSDGRSHGQRSWPPPRLRATCQSLGQPPRSTAFLSLC